MLLLVTGCPAVTPCPSDGSACDDGNACTTDTCNTETNTCAFTPVECGTGETCSGGVCITPCDTAADCDDGDVCTADACTNGACGSTAIAGCCEVDADCDDSNVCTDDACDTAANTCSNTNNTAACDDGSVCTENDACAGGACAGTDIAGCCETDADCDTAAGETCTVDNVCEAACVDDADCDDGDACTDDTCVSGACDNTAVDCGNQVCRPGDGACVDCINDAGCDDGFACTSDICNNFVCENNNINSRCDDFLFCTGDEFCDPNHPDADADGCWATGDSCGGTTPICNESTNACDACTSTAQCNDGFSCTTDTCLGDGSCQNTPDNTACDDGLFCTEIDICDPNGENADATTGCVNEGDPCDLPVAAGFFSQYRLCNEGTDACDDCTGNADCDDGIGCTSDTCDGGSGICTSQTDDTLCDDGLYCTDNDWCCPDCEDADADGCIYEGDPCGGQLCEELANDYQCVDCQSNAECDDGVDCTDDFCDGLSGNCSNIPNNDNCGTGEVCDSVDGCIAP